MLTYNGSFSSKQFRHLGLRQSDGFVIHSYFQTNCIVGIIQNYFAIVWRKLLIVRESFHGFIFILRL